MCKNSERKFVLWIKSTETFAPLDFKKTVPSHTPNNVDDFNKIRVVTGTVFDFNPFIK